MEGEKGGLGSRGPQVCNERVTASGFDLGFNLDVLVVSSLQTDFIACELGKVCLV